MLQLLKQSLSLLLLLVTCVCLTRPSAHATQLPLGYLETKSRLVELTALSSDDFTTLSHADFPDYSVRIKRTEFCDSTVG